MCAEQTVPSCSSVPLPVATVLSEHKTNPAFVVETLLCTRVLDPI